MGLDNIFSNSFKDYKKNFKLILKSYWWFYILPLIVMLGFLYGIVMGFQDSQNYSVFFIVSLIILTIGFGFFNYWLGLILIYVALYNKKGDMRFKQVAGKSIKYFWRMLGLLVILGLALLGLFILLIIPAVIFWIFWIFSAYVLIGENKGIIGSMKRSKAIVKGRWWHVFGYTLLIVLVAIGVSILFSIPQFIMGFVTQVFPNLFFIIFANVINFIFGLVSTILITPFVIFFFKNLYLELKRK